MRNVLPALFCLVLLPGIALSQTRSARSTGDTLDRYRTFIRACNAYKQRPLQLQLELSNSTNVVGGNGDTAAYQADFFLAENGAYTRIGELEQLVTDSVALLVSRNLQRMILFQDAGAMTERLNALIGPGATDSSAFSLAKKYSITLGAEDNHTTMRLTSRALLPYSLLPKESIELQRGDGEKDIQRVLTIKRTLLPLTDEDYAQLQQKPESKDYLLSVPGKGNFLLKEQRGLFVYKSIRHESIPLPVTLSDRVRKDAQGNFVAAKGFEEYTLTLN